MTIVEALKEVMRNAGVPLTAREAYDAIVAKSLYEFHAKDPKHVVLMQIRRHCVGVDFPTASPSKHFGLQGDNHFYPLPKVVKFKGTKATKGNKVAGKGAKARPPEPESSLVGVEKNLWALHAEYLELFCTHMVGELRKLTPGGFESFARELLDAYGFEETHVTSISRDGGIDGYGKLRVGLAHLNVAFQCKRWTKRNIQRQDIDQFRGASQGAYEQGIFFTTSSFSPGSIGASIKRGAIPIVLIDGSAIVKLMIDKKLRVESNVMEIPAFAL